MNVLLALGTSDGCVVAERTGVDWRVASRGLAEQTVTAVAAREGRLWAGTLDGIFCSQDRGETWHDASDGLTVRHLRWLASTPPGAPGGILAGTEPAAIFWSEDGQSWREYSEVAQLRDQHGWWLPYSPADGCVRGFAALGERAYAAAEVGGVLRAVALQRPRDGGPTWDLAPASGADPRNFQPPAPLIHPDVHSIAVHPSSPDLVTAPTGGGLYRSRDGGAAWTLLYPCYCRAVWVDPRDADHLVFGPADGVSRNGRIEQSYDGGATWHPASGRLEVPWARHMVERFTQVGGALLAVLSNGELLVAELRSATLDWRPILPEIPGVRCAAVL
jgi:photosystem II stability/assembly factor-like uncharacterized protein